MAPERLIPARAGKTVCISWGVFVRQAHPRAGGENLVTTVYRFSAGGSSPRGRGKLRPRTQTKQLDRLIPARAGKTRQSMPRPPNLAAHPRAGGENNDTSGLSQTANGSSPRGRGKPAAPGKIAVIRRLIPARAGKTGSPNLPTHHLTAHPRAGGENASVSLSTRESVGSSPRGRGKLHHLT